MRRVFKTKSFFRSTKKANLGDEVLCKAIDEIERGLVDADLGGGIIKKRVSSGGKGKSGGARTIVATNRSGVWFFLYAFAKNERANISSKELAALQMLAADLLARTPAQCNELVARKILWEICHAESPTEPHP
jgi:hypothetical protein